MLQIDTLRETETSLIALSTHQLVGLKVAPEGGALECSSLVQGESLAMLSGEVEKGELPSDGNQHNYTNSSSQAFSNL